MIQLKVNLSSPGSLFSRYPTASSATCEALVQAQSQGASPEVIEALANAYMFASCDKNDRFAPALELQDVIQFLDHPLNFQGIPLTHRSHK